MRLEDIKNQKSPYKFRESIPPTTSEILSRKHLKRLNQNIEKIKELGKKVIKPK